MNATHHHTVAELEAHLAIAEELMNDAALYLWDVVIELDMISPVDADALARNFHDSFAEFLQTQLDDLKRYMLEPEPEQPVEEGTR